MNKNSMQILARLEAMMAIKTAQILANPIPALDECRREINRTIRCLHDLDEILSPNTAFDMAQDMGIHPRDILGEERVMNRKVRERISRYLAGD